MNPARATSRAMRPGSPARGATAPSRPPCSPASPAAAARNPAHPAGSPGAARPARVPECAASVRHAAGGVHCPRPAGRCGLGIRLTHRRPAFPPGPRARRPAPRDGRSAGTRLPGAAARAGAAPWLQFWLQFTRVQGMPGGFTCPGQDARGPERTAEPRTLIRGSEFDPLTPHLRRRSFRGSCRGTVRGAAHARSVCGLFPWPSSLVTQSDYRQLAARLRVWAAR